MQRHTPYFRRFLFGSSLTMSLDCVGSPPPGYWDPPAHQTTSSQTTDGQTDSEPTMPQSDTSDETGESSTIHPEICGNYAVKFSEEECDLGINNGDNSCCLSDCTRNTCGDGFHLIKSDKAAAICPSETMFEECDDGNDDPEDACTSECRLPVCGDGHVYRSPRLEALKLEECDDKTDTADCYMCQMNRLAFVSSVTIDGGMKIRGECPFTSKGLCPWINAEKSGIERADRLCRALAYNAGILAHEHFKAWLGSEFESPATRFHDASSFSGRYVRTDGVYVTTGGWGVLANVSQVEQLTKPLERDEQGILVGPDAYAWSNVGSMAATLSTDDCAGWSWDPERMDHANLRGGVGKVHATDSWWTDVGDVTCAVLRHVYCVQDGPLL